MIDTNENNPIIKENQSTSEIKSGVELQSQIEIDSSEREFAQSAEFKKNNTASKKGDDNKKSKLNTSLFSTITTSFVAVAVMAFIGFTSLINVNFKASFTSFAFEDGLIRYSVELENYDEEEIIIYLYDDNRQLIEQHIITEQLNENHIDGVIEIDLEDVKEQLNKKSEANEDATITYYATLKADVGLDVEREFDQYAIDINMLETSFNEVTGHCECSKDGYYYFLMDFIDQNGYFTDFEAYIIDGKGSIYQCNFSNNLHDEQKIYIGNAAGSKGTLIITYNSNGESQEIKIEIEI